MLPTIEQMHDASLVAIRFDWRRRVCVLEFLGAPGFPDPFTVSFTGVTAVLIPAEHAWGESESLLEVTDRGGGRYEFVMQSGDTITVVAPENSFNPTRPGGMA